MFGLGTSELLIILLVLLLVFGATRLPALGRGLGLGLRGFRDAMRGEDDKKDDKGEAVDEAKKDA